MKTKFFFLVFFFAAFFVLKSAMASASYAAVVSGTLDNRQGLIPISVTVTFTRGNSSQLDLQTVTVPLKQSMLITSVNDTNGTGSNPPYTITWTTTCGSGFAQAAWNGSTYDFGAPNVHCTTTNSSLFVSATSCSGSNGSVSWNVTNIGANGANIDNFKVYKVSAPATNSDLDTDPTIVAYAAETNSYLTSGPANPKLTNLGSGTWNIIVKAYPPNGDPGISVDNSHSFTCGSGVSNPYNLNANVACSGSSNRIDLSWSGPSLGAFTYLVQYKLTNSDPGPLDTDWNSTTLAPNPTTGTYLQDTTTFTGASKTYFWRVKATPSPTTGQVYYSSSASFTTNSLCPGASVTSPLIRRVRNCYDFSVATASAADPTKAQVDWASASGSGSVVSESLEWGADEAFTAGTFQSISASTGYIITSGLQLGSVNNIRVRTLYSDGKWYTSQTVPVYMPSTCPATYTSPTQLLGYADCQNGQVYVHLHWTRVPNDSVTEYRIWQQGNLVTPSWLSNVWFWDSGPMASVPNGESFQWYVEVVNDSALHDNSLNLTIDNPQCSVPTVPDTLSVTANTAPCTSPIITFSFKDQSYSETAFWLEVSSEPFTGPVSTNPHNTWGIKKITSTLGPLPAEQAQTGRTVTFVWQSGASSNTSGPLGGGNANPGGQSGNQLIPLDGVRYYWRVKAVDFIGQGTYVYKDSNGVVGSALPPGIPVFAPVCKPQHDLKVTIDTTSWFDNTTNISTNSFQAADSVKVNVIVENISSQNITALPQSADNSNMLWFFFNSLPAACTASAPGAGGLALPLGLLVGGLNPGDSITFPVTFTVGATAASQTAYADVAPACTFSDTGIDPFTTNNVSSGATYLVGINGFFQTQGGDVGASGNISAGGDGSCEGFYQSDYAIAGNSIGSTIKGKPTGTYTNAVATANVASKPTPGPVTSITFDSSTGGGSGFPDGSIKVLIYAGNGIGSGATATATASGGSIIGVTLGSGGSGYIANPLIRFCRPGAGFKLANYSGKPLLKSHVYSYLASNFRSKAIAQAQATSQQCTLTDGGAYNGLYYCGVSANNPNGDMTIANTTTPAGMQATITISGKAVFFIDGDLNIYRSNLGLLQVNLLNSLNDAMVFVVRGNINVYALATDLSGVFVARKSFNDCTFPSGSASYVNGCAMGASSNKLTITGGLYVDGEDIDQNKPAINLQRFFSPTMRFNIQTPTDKFIFDPKYLVMLSDLLAQPAVGWKEIAP